jgi:iron(III) transport system permease protein
LNRWRWGLAILLVTAIGIPLIMPMIDLIRHPEGWGAWNEADRLAGLAGNTISLILGTISLAIPAGTLTAILLYRTDLPGRGVFRFVTILALFVPLPLLVTAWQSTWGAGGWLANNQWYQVTVWRPWVQGLPAAIWIHTMAGIPWVVLIVGLGLRWVERELEEDASMTVGPWSVIWHVTLPRSRTAIWAAALWVALQAATEISATDMTQVRTFAEEVYTQLVGGGSSAVAASVAVAIPSIGITWLIAALGAGHLARKLPPLENLSRSPLQFPLGKSRWPCFFAMVAMMGLLIGVPVAALVWKTGLAGAPPVWSISTFERYLLRAFHAHVWTILRSLGSAGVAGALTAFLALLACWLATESSRFQWVCLALLSAAWALPGPLVGFGLKDTIKTVLNYTDPLHSERNVIEEMLWSGPSPTPILWVYLIRFFPFALAMLWPAVRLMPREFLESARMDGARPAQEFRHVIFPISGPAFLLTSLAVTVLCLGEISASKLVETPGWDTLVHVIFDRMHYGVGNDLAAICLLLLMIVFLGGIAVVSIGGLIGRNKAQYSE